MWAIIFKALPEIFKNFPEFRKQFERTASVAIVLVVSLMASTIYLAVDKYNTVDRYESIIGRKDALIAEKDAELKDLNKKLLTAYADAENTFVDRYLSNYEKLERTFIGREKTQKSQISKIENLTKQNEKYVNKIEKLNNKNSEK